jgi:alpha-L-rhamnosidase
MRSQMMPPIKNVRELAAVSLRVLPASQNRSTQYVYDFGQEFAGVARLTLQPPLARGLNVTLQFGEALSHPPIGPADGSVFMGNLYWANPVDHYITRGGNHSEIYEPIFTYHGFRYVQLSVAGGRLDPAPTIESLVGVNRRSSVAEAATMRFGSSAADW